MTAGMKAAARVRSAVKCIVGLFFLGILFLWRGIIVNDKKGLGSPLIFCHCVGEKG